MDDNEGLFQLLHSATLGRSSQSQLGRSVEANDRNTSGSPLQNSLLATLLPGKEGIITGKRSPSILKSSSPAESSSTAPLVELFRTVSPSSPAGLTSQPRVNITQSLQELQLDAIKCDSTAISQVKHASRRSAVYGNLISVTRHCIAYVLNDRKIRLIAQENAAMGLMDLHNDNSLPIVDIAWNMQDAPVEAGLGLHSHPSQQLLASLSLRGEVYIGAIYAESSSNLVYEPIYTTTFPELQAARGLAWNELDNTPLIAIFGSGPEVYLLSVRPTVRTAALTTDLNSIEAIRFGDNGSRLFIAGLDRIVIVSVRSIEDTFTAQTIPLLPGVQRVWLFPHVQGIIAVASIGTDQLLILPLFGGSDSEVIVSINLPGSSDQLFATFDQLTNVICLGANNTQRFVCLNLSSLNNPIVSAGKWPNESGTVSAFATSQLHSVFSKSGSNNDGADMFLYAYHNDSVKMHRLSIRWETTKSANEPEHLPTPSQEILRPSRGSTNGGANLNPAISTNSSVVSPPSNMTVGQRENSAELSQNIIDAISRQLNEQNKQLRRERREIELAEQRRQQELLSTTLQGIQQAIVSNLHSVVQQEMTRALDSRMSVAMEQTLGRIEQQFNQKFEGVVARSVGRPEKFSASIATQLTQPIMNNFNQSVKDAVESCLLPGLQSIMTDLVGQLSANITQAIVDSSIEQYKVIMNQLNDLRQTVIELQHCAFKLPSAQELAQSVTQEIRQSFSPIPNSQTSHKTNPLIELESLVSSGKGSLALIKALELGDISALNWILPRLDPTTVLDSQDILPAVMVSLAQQLGYDLHSLKELKLAWLAELFTIFDPRHNTDPEINATLPGVLDELFANLRIIFAETPASSPDQKQIKTVMRLVRMAMAA